MTKLYVFSDSHGRTERMHSIILSLEADYLIHCGDFANDLSGHNVYHVKGNCDPWSKAPLEVLITIENKKVLIVHGHKHQVKSGLLSLSYYAQQKQADIVLFGHTHTPTAVVENGILLLNPGSISLPNYGQSASYLELNIDGDEINYRFHTLED